MNVYEHYFWVGFPNSDDPGVVKKWMCYKKRLMLQKEDGTEKVLIERKFTPYKTEQQIDSHRYYQGEETQKKGKDFFKEDIK